jgi:hypothetical protein
MKIYIKSRGNLRSQDYIYWLDENSSSEQSPKILKNLALLDDRNPGILLLYQHGYYHLLLSSLDSDRQEPSSPSPIRNFIFFTEIEEEEAIFLTRYALQNWKELAEEVDGAIQTDDSVYGYKFECDRLEVIKQKHLVSDRSGNLYPKDRSNPKKQLTKDSTDYGGIGSDEWKDLAYKLDKYSLPKKERNIIILVTKYQSFSDNRHSHILLSDEPRKSSYISNNDCKILRTFKTLGDVGKNMTKDIKNAIPDVMSKIFDDSLSDPTSSNREGFHNNDKNGDDS